MAEPVINSTNVHELLVERARQTPDIHFLFDTHRRAPMNCRELLHHSEKVAQTLNGWGFGPGDRIATLVGGGAESATLMWGITCCATYAPLNPKLHPAEIARALADLKIKAIVVEKGAKTTAREAADASGLPIIELLPQQDAPAGSFSLSCISHSASSDTHMDFTGPEDTFCVLQTSGTTARPKTVPMTQRDFLRAVSHNVRLLQLTPADRCLHVLATSHVMGITTVIYSHMAGSQVVCTPGFQAAEFFRWAREFEPTWFTAPPAIHQSILRHAGEHADFIAHHPPRFIRSGAAMLSMALLEEIQRVWHAPLIEAYAMSECPLITSNSAPPGRHRPGSVGVPCGAEVALLDESGNFLSAGSEMSGEIAIRGPNLMSGYEDNPAANDAAFLDGWFRTGDLGQFDSDGFLFWSAAPKKSSIAAERKLRRAKSTRSCSPIPQLPMP